MTIATTTAKSRYAGDGGTTSFPTGFKFLENDHVRVILLQGDGAENLWTEGSEYSLSGAGAPGGGTVTVSTSPSDFTPQAGDTLVIKLAIPAEQQTALPLGGAFPSTAVEGMADLAALRDQQIEEALSRAVKFKETTALADVEFPEPEAGKVARWNAAGNALENSALPTFLDGSGAPADSLGEVDDRYIDNDTGDVYRKTGASSWTLTGNFEGPQGVQGIQGVQGVQGVQGPQGDAGVAVLFGTGVPAGGLGGIGDYFKDTDSGDFYEKTGASAWTLRGNDTGPQGATGAQGIQGIQGIQGVAGNDGADGADGVNITPQGTYNAGTSYSVDDGVTFDGSFWRSLQSSNLGNTPDISPASWEQTVAKGDTGPAGGGLANVVDDTTPELGGELDGQGNAAVDVPLNVVAAEAASFTFAADQAGRLVPCNSGLAMNATVPANATTAFAIGTTLAIWNQGAGAVTWVAAGGVTLNVDPALTLVSNGQHAVSFAVKVATNTWVVAGGLAAV